MKTAWTSDYLQWRISYTGSGGYYRLQNKRSGKYLNVKGGGVTPDLPLVQYTYFADYLSEQWRFDEVNVTEPLQARGASGGRGAPAAAAGLRAYPNPATGSSTWPWTPTPARPPCATSRAGCASHRPWAAPPNSICRA